MINTDFTKLSRKQLIEHFEQERQEWLAAGMSEADIFRIHFGEGNEKGRGGDYRMWLDKRKHTRPDRKYSTGAPVSIDAVDREGAWIGDGCKELDIVEFNIDFEVALSTLTELQRFCFVSAVVNGMTHQSIADVLKTTRQNVDKHVRAATKKIKSFFEA